MYYLFEIIRYFFMIVDIFAIAITFAMAMSLLGCVMFTSKLKVEVNGVPVEGPEFEKLQKDVRNGILQVGLYNLVGCVLLFIPLDFLHNLVNPY